MPAHISSVGDSLKDYPALVGMKEIAKKMLLNNDNFGTPRFISTAMFFLSIVTVDLV